MIMDDKAGVVGERRSEGERARCSIDCRRIVTSGSDGRFRKVVRNRGTVSETPKVANGEGISPSAAA